MNRISNFLQGNTEPQHTMCNRRAMLELVKKPGLKGF